MNGDGLLPALDSTKATEAIATEAGKVLDKVEEMVSGKDLKFLENMFFNIVASAIIVAIALGVYFIVKNVIKRWTLKVNTKSSKNSKKKATILKLVLSIFRYLLFIVVVLIVLEVFGINVTSIVAGLGVVSVIIGLALQDALKDIIMGFNIIIDDYYSVGDLITVGDIHGTVMEVGLKATKIKDFANDNIYVIGNRNITAALTDSNLILIELPMPYEEPVQKVEEIIETIMKRAKELEPELDDIKYMGISSYGDSAIYYRLHIYAEPHRKYQVRRNIYRLIKNELDSVGVSIPYNQIDVHSKGIN